MTHLENNYEEWKETRGRVDSIANAIFLIAGGALTLSVSVLLSNKADGLITEQAASIAASAWRWLLGAIVTFLTLKGEMVLHAYLFQFHTGFVNKHLNKFNISSWLIGGFGFIAFVVGLIKMVNVATLIIMT